MKINISRTFALLLVAGSLATACKDKDAEKKIAELEAELKDLKGQKPVEAQSPVVQNTPVADEKPEGPVAAINFGSLEHDFGTIKEGDVVEHTFSFKNTGDVPLIIQNAQPSCGCTAPDWSKNPIPVGGTGFVKAKFDSNGKPNLQQKTITVTANTFPKQTILRFKAMVTPKQAEPPADGPRKK